MIGSEALIWWLVLAWSARRERLAKSRVEHPSSESVVLLHQPIKVWAPKLSPDSGHPIPDLVFKRDLFPSAKDVPMNAADPGTLLSERWHGADEA